MKKLLSPKIGLVVNKMRGIIIINQDNAHNEYKIKRLYEEAASLNITLETYVNDGSLAKVENGNVITNISGDFIIYLDKDIYLAKLLEKAGFRLFNKPDFLKLCDDKMLTYITLVNQGIPMPLTMSAPLIYRDKISENNYSFLKKVIENIGLPVVVKRNYGSLGEGVFIANNLEELEDIYSKNFMHPLLFQSYIESSKGRSIRALVIDGKFFGAFERCNSMDFRSNFHDGASAKEVELTPDYLELVNKLTKILDIKYAGIDLLYGKDGPVLCEINSNAFFEVFEQVTKKNVAKEYLKMILNNVK